MVFLFVFCCYALVCIFFLFFRLGLRGFVIFWDYFVLYWVVRRRKESVTDGVCFFVADVCVFFFYAFVALYWDWGEGWEGSGGYVIRWVWYLLKNFVRRDVSFLFDGFVR